MYASLFGRRHVSQTNHEEMLKHFRVGVRAMSINDSETERSGIEQSGCMALIAYEVGVRATSSFQHIK